MRVHASYVFRLIQYFENRIDLLVLQRLVILIALLFQINQLLYQRITTIGPVRACFPFPSASVGTDIEVGIRLIVPPTCLW